MYWFSEGSWGCGKIYRPVLQLLLPMDGLSDQFLLKGQLFSSLGPHHIFRSFSPLVCFFPLLKCQWLWVLVFFFSFCLCVICFLNLPLNSLFDSFLCASCKKHFVFASRQHLTMSSVLPACNHTPCQSKHNKSERNKCLTCQLHFPLSAVQTAKVNSHSNFSHRQH